MHTPTLVLHTLLAASGALAGAPAGEGVSHPHKRAAALRNKNPKLTRAIPEKRDSSANPSYLTSKTESERALSSSHPLFTLAVKTPQTDALAEFVVNGTGVPEVSFDLGESYAGRLPITSLNATNATANELFFWFFPSENELASNEIVIWLNGGPGCSSMDGLFQENGPFLWQSGTYAPQPNPFAWTNLTNMVWIDQPVGTGLSLAAPGVPATIKDETDVAEDFAGFWKNFIETFDMQGYDVYLTGESYAGMCKFIYPLVNTTMWGLKSAGSDRCDQTFRISRATSWTRTIPRTTT